ncbi:MAG: hypothetical protein ACI9MC_004228 [Kiritimatiellia bacterium]|jgi:hypothetical protein
MSPDIMAQALRATARIAGCAALVACAPSITDSLPPVDDQYADVDTSSDSEVSELEACRDEVTETFSDDRNITDQTEDCCQVIAEHYDSQDLVGLEEWGERLECCELLNWSGSMACTPWGPPVPPSMPSQSRVT